MLTPGTLEKTSRALLVVKLAVIADNFKTSFFFPTKSTLPFTSGCLSGLCLNGVTITTSKSIAVCFAFLILSKAFCDCSVCCANKTEVIKSEAAIILFLIVIFN